MKRFLMLVAAVCAAAGGLFAESVTADQAKILATAWARENGIFGAGGAATAVRTVCDTNAAQTVLWHQVSLANGSALMVAPVTEIEPVLAALEEDPGDLPAAHPLRGILAADVRERLRFLGLYTEDAAPARRRLSAAALAPGGTNAGDARTTNEIAAATAWGLKQAAKWARLAGIGAAPTLNEANGVGVKDPIASEIGIVKGFEKGGPLTHWNQGSAGGGYCYNYYTTNHVVCGCAATALSALLQFFEVERVAPLERDCAYNGAAVKAHTLQSDDSMSLTQYDWSLFADCTSRTNYDQLSEAQREMLGRVAYDAGVCLKMNWGDDSSSAIGGQTAGILRKCFGYIDGTDFKAFAEARYVTSPTASQYEKLIYTQLRAGVPVQMDIEGHAVVAVGFGRDGDGVARTRVFMGWGGSGDAWYALPDIDTTAVLGGSSYLSSVITAVATFLGYKDDRVVPVVGQIIPAMGAEVTCGEEKLTANACGAFGTRLSAASAQTVTLSCLGKTATATTGKLPDPESTDSGKTDGEALCAAVPVPVTIYLLNSQAASTAEEAQQMALAAGKPMLFFSGISREAASDAMWQIIDDLDEGNVKNFTNKFVIAYFTWSSSPDSPSDGKPSYGVFDPTVYDAANHWAFYNGRLAYDSYVAFTTNITANATNYVATAEAKARMMAVIDDGYRSYLCYHSGIALEIVADPSGSVTNAVENSFTNGETVVYSYPAVTNAEQGVVWTNTNWQVNAVAADGSLTAVTNGTGPNVAFVATADTVYRLTAAWAVAAVCVRATVKESADWIKHGRVKYGETVSLGPISVWTDVGDSVTFAAIPENGYRATAWQPDNRVVLGTVTVTESDTSTIDLTVSFVKAVKCQLSVSETPTWSGGPFAASTPVAVGSTTNCLSGEHTLRLDSSTRKIGNQIWCCTGWSLSKGSPDSGTGATAAFLLEEDATLTWQWALDVNATLVENGWNPTQFEASQENLGILPNGIAAEDVTYANLPAGWTVTPSITENNEVQVKLVPSATSVTPAAIAFSAVMKTDTGFRLSFTNATKWCYYDLYSAATPNGFDLSGTPVQTQQWTSDKTDGFFDVPDSGTGCFWRVLARPGQIPSAE